MNPYRKAVTTTAALALVSASLFAAATLLPASAVAAPVGRTDASTSVLHHRVRSAGRYDVQVVITTHAHNRVAKSHSVVRVDIGGLSRRVRTNASGRATLGLKLHVKKGTLTIRAISHHERATIAMKMSKIARPKAPSTKATGSTGATAPAAPAAAAPVAAPLVAKFAPDGAPILALPASFASIVNYTNLVKDYEFTGSSLPADWTASANNSHGYDTMYQPSQVTMTGSSVALTATNQSSDGYPTTSGWISTEGQYSLTHGLIEFSAKMPAGQGLWSGLWLDQPDGSNPWGEIDVAEMLLNNTTTLYGSAHAWAPSDWGETQSTTMSADASQGFHDYQVAWQPGLITWAVDGIAYAQYTQAEAAAAGYPWVFDDGSGFYLIANLAVGTSSEWSGAPDASTAFPASMLVHSVKVWQ
jgi:beta-glucanase (GH16 family)